ncbi:MAG: GNAT family N-acetyltransferase [Chitinophagaceae bacterium]|nr:GNAT family N-acetyltransferase [Chitinophagaceae bacterium]MCW5925811.1 GNAT family N-acetyltransferase [Chitinophagaceae bacterium]
MKIETERLVLTPVTLDDLDTFSDIITDPFVRKYLFDDMLLEKEQAREFIETSKQLFLQKKYGLWLLRQQERNEVIGFAGLWHFFDENKPQLLYAILPTYTRQGFAKEASMEIINYAFEILAFDYLEASCDTPNISSLNTAISIGMTRTNDKIIDNKAISFFRINRNED